MADEKSEDGIDIPLVELWTMTCPPRRYGITNTKLTRWLLFPSADVPATVVGKKMLFDEQ